MKKVLYRTKQRFILVTRDGITHSYAKYGTFLFDYSALSLVLMQAFPYQAIYIVATSDIRVLGDILYRTCNVVGFYRIKSVLGTKYISHG